ncbi:hypothetical protein [Corynebacterium xerosis]|uniref:Uncharacterized protein n=1 Tax=Corynebacterium xerosis TaxID=1725 RepID=A0A7X9SWI0_9CORY|nr:hypothetical protein [Corynebacterium xerosis]NMF09338.1 hypothetical protein [Corynebacterium xerosis]
MNTYSTNVEKWAVTCKDVGNAVRRRCPRPMETRAAIHGLITALGVFTCEAMELSEPGPADQWQARYSDIPDTTIYSLYAVHPPSAARPVWAGGRYFGQTLTVPVFTDAGTVWVIRVVFRHAGQLARIERLDFPAPPPEVRAALIGMLRSIHAAEDRSGMLGWGWGHGSVPCSRR